MKKGFTLVEVLIVVAIIAVLASAVFFANFFANIGKSRDARRKAELNTMQKLLEDYYNDNDQYLTVDTISIDGFGCQTDPERFKPYLSRLPCDPQYPNRTYAYVSDDGSYQKYRIYALMEYTTDPDVKENPCINGCSVSGRTYNYVVTSPNIDLISYPNPPGGYIGPDSGGLPTATPGAPPTNTPAPTAGPTNTPPPGPTNTPAPTAPPTNTPAPTQGQCPADPATKYCIQGTSCINCGTFSNCNKQCAGGQLYSDNGCSNQCSP